MRRLNKLNEAHAIVKFARRDLESIDRLSLSEADVAQFATELGTALEALEYLRVKLQCMVVKEKLRGAK